MNHPVIIMPLEFVIIYCYITLISHIDYKASIFQDQWQGWVKLMRLTVSELFI